jgi:hypothetical protein
VTRTLAGGAIRCTEPRNPILRLIFWVAQTRSAMAEEMAVAGRRTTIGVSVCLALALALLGWLWLFPPLPDEQQVMALYAAHRQEFAVLVEMIEPNCLAGKLSPSLGGEMSPEATAVASRIDPRMKVFCDHDGTVRFILGVRGLMTIGPELIIGLTYILGDPARWGSVVPALEPHEQEVGEVFLRQVDSHWYVFTQNTE